MIIVNLEFFENYIYFSNVDLAICIGHSCDFIASLLRLRVASAEQGGT